jgi:hypothetical protein
MYSNIVKDPINHPAIELPSIRYLVIHLESSQSVGVLPLLDLPSVETLIILNFYHYVIPAFAQHYQPYPSVQSLKMASTDSPAMSIATTLHFISLFPNVQEIAFYGGDAATILALLYDRDELLWPQLSTITVIPSQRTGALWKKQTWAHISKVVDNRLLLKHPISQIILSSQILKCGSYRQQQRLREQVALRVLEGRITSSSSSSSSSPYASELYSAGEWPPQFFITGKPPYSKPI